MSYRSISLNNSRETANCMFYVCIFNLTIPALSPVNSIILIIFKVNIFNIYRSTKKLNAIICTV